MEKEHNQTERLKRGDTSSGEDWSKYFITAVVIGLLLIGTATAGYQEDLRGKNQLEVIEYWLAEEPPSPRAIYELCFASDAFTSKGCKKDSFKNGWQELRIWVAAHKDEARLVKNNLIVIND